MLIQDQYVKIKWSGSNKKWFEDKGYAYTKTGDEFFVKAEDLMPSSKTKVKVQCDYCGKIIEKSFGHYIQEISNFDKISCSDHKCIAQKSSETQRAKFAESQIQKFYDKCDFWGYIPVSTIDDYTTAKGKVQFICPTHGLKEICYSNFVYGDSKCYECSMEEFSQNSKFSKEQVQEIIESKNNNKWINPDEYIGARVSNLKILCGSCGKIYTTSLDAYQSHTGKCHTCSHALVEDSRRKSIEEVRDIVESQNNNKLLNPEDYQNCLLDNLKIQCGCGNIYTTSLENYKRRFGGKCNKCGIRSIGESRIAKFLDEHSITYITQESFDGECRDKKPLPFDFYLPDYNLCIEFDGQHHYEPVFGEKTFLDTLLHDGMKNNYCRWNGIDFLRISYLDGNNIEEILKDYLGIKNHFQKIEYIPTAERKKRNKFKEQNEDIKLNK